MEFAGECCESPMYQSDVCLIKAADCDVQFENFGAPTTDGGCTMACAGNSTEFCGGPSRLNVYNFTGTITAPVTPTGGGGGGGTPVAVTDGLPPRWAYSGCYM